MENLICNFTIPIDPKTKKNSQRVCFNKRTGRYFVLPSESYVKYEKECKTHIPKLGINEKVNVKAIYYRKTKMRVDLCNLHEALCDVLVKYGCVEDDNSNIIHSMDGSCVKYDKDNPRTEVFISRL